MNMRRIDIVEFYRVIDGEWADLGTADLGDTGTATQILANILGDLTDIGPLGAIQMETNKGRGEFDQVQRVHPDLARFAFDLEIGRAHV